MTSESRPKFCVRFR